MPDNILSKLFFQDTNGWNNVFPNGGVPLYNSDIRALENTSKMYGAWTFLKDYDCIVSGCLVDEVNTDIKTVKITEGYFVISGIMYHTDGFTTTYPFSLIPGSQTSDDRIFKNGDTFAVATTYNYSIKTIGFSVYDVPGSNQPTLPIKPDNLVNEIFFDPFTNQRLEFIQTYTLRSGGECIWNNNLAAQTARLTLTQTGNPIIGLEVLLEFQTGGGSIFLPSNGRWKYYGWRKSIYQGLIPRINNASTTTQTGNDTVVLTKSNLPRHKHGYGTLGLTDSLNFILDTPSRANDIDRGNSSSSFSLDSITATNFKHTHSLYGSVDDGSSDGLSANPDPVNISPKTLNFAVYEKVPTNTSYYIRNNINNNHYQF